MLVVALALGAASCSRIRGPGFPPPARPSVFVAAPAAETFEALKIYMETQGMPILVEDRAFGNLITDWIVWSPGEIDLASRARCDVPRGAPAPRARGRFAFEVRPRADQSFVTILAHYQAELERGFDRDEDGGFVDCPSTGEWERTVAEGLTQAQMVR